MKDKKDKIVGFQIHAIKGLSKLLDIPYEDVIKKYIGESFELEDLCVRQAMFVMDYYTQRGRWQGK